MVWVKREGGYVMGVALRRGTAGHDEKLPDDHPDVLAFQNRDPFKPWPEQMGWTPDQHQAHDNEAALKRADIGRLSTVLLIKLVDKLLEKGVIVAADFDADTRAEYQQVKGLVDTFRP